jgi:hypothetical protein
MRSSSFSLPPSRQRPGVLADLGALLEALGLRRDDEGGVPARAELAVDRRDDDVHAGDTAVRGPCLLAVEDPLVGGLVVARHGADRRDIGPGVGLRGAEGGHRRLLDGPEALRQPLADLLAGALAEDRRDGEPGAHDRHADAGIAPEELLVDDRQHQPAGVGVELRQRIEPVEADLGRLSDDRPRRLLALVPFVGGRAHDAFGEAVDPVADVFLVLGERQRERRLGLLGGRGLFGDRGHSQNVSVQKSVVRRHPRDLKRTGAFGALTY